MEPIIGDPIASFTDLLLDTVCMVDVSGRFVFVSAACENLFGFTQQEMIGKLMIDLVAPVDRERTLAAARNIMNGLSHINFENRYVRKDGGIVHIMWSARWSETHQLRVAVARDVTALKQAQAMQAALYAISEAAHASEDLVDLFERSHAIIGELLPAACFGVALFDASGQQLDFAYLVERDVPSNAAIMRLLCDEVLLRRAALLLEPGTAEVLSAPLRAAANDMAGSALAVPLATPQGIVGVIALRTGAAGTHYTAADRDLLLFVADQLAATIERKQLHAQMRFMAMHDELTRLPNRRLFDDRLDTALARAHRQHEGLSLLFIDLDRFKHVNDQYGHACGDILLQQVARRIASCLRDTDTLARMGGDEFVVLLENISPPSDAALVMEKIHQALAAPVELGEGRQLQISVSVGMAHYPEHGDSRQQLVSHADKAMYAAKTIGALGEPAA
ncbi:sensor domain-containing protein [Massilia yuzhufengensis]|uniref:Diguanylate cyclase with PAS/PAC and GAF sensors n=1 Tax=Massilia yuzhufengensis TaxID=1164594 RepID=A0A1I1UFG8_9BURK|nr:diguanylate cyclase [Massilia yuzhufengensis]SFD68348.1 diguanylate cyclase with PAS/PAC and GAF sensors [Massilia yuzhufengensis]